MSLDRSKNFRFTNRIYILSYWNDINNRINFNNNSKNYLIDEIFSLIMPPGMCLSDNFILKNEL